MPFDSDPPSNQPHKDEPALADELGIGDLSDSVFCARGRIFSAAGRETPVAEITDTHLLLYPPGKPFDEHAFAEEISIRVSEDGILLDEFGHLRRIVGAHYRGQELYCMGEKGRLSGKYQISWFDQNEVAHILYYQDRELTIAQAFRLRNATHDGEISAVTELSSDSPKG
jgi:hypothetical protein